MATEDQTRERERCSCLCGAVTFSVALKGNDVVACHCRMCQKWAGGISLAIECEPDIDVDDMRHVGVYRSSEWGERVFCTRCGSPLFWRMQDGSLANIPPSALDRPLRLALRTEFCVDRKPDYYRLDGEAKQVTEAEMIALYSDGPAGSAS